MRNKTQWITGLSSRMWVLPRMLRPTAAREGAFTCAFGYNPVFACPRLWPFSKESFSHLPSAPVPLVGSRNNCSFCKPLKQPICIFFFELLSGTALALLCPHFSALCKEGGALLPRQESTRSPRFSARGCLSSTETPRSRRQLGTPQLSLHALSQKGPYVHQTLTAKTYLPTVMWKTDFQKHRFWKVLELSAKNWLSVHLGPGPGKKN